MTKEDFLIWKNVKRSLNAVGLYSGPITINNHVLLTQHCNLSTVLVLGEEGSVIDGYSIFGYDRYQGVFVKDILNITVDNLHI